MPTPSIGEAIIKMQALETQLNDITTQVDGVKTALTMDIRKGLANVLAELAEIKKIVSSTGA